MRNIRAALATLAVWLLPALVVAPAAAQTKYPDRPVKIIVGFTPGSSTDITARMFAQKFQETWGIPVTVENVPGAGGSVSAERVSKATPDGYTLLWGANGALTIVPGLQPNLAYDPRKDLAPISQLLVMPSIVALNNDVPAKTLQEFLALAKAQPGKLSYASPGVGTPQHVAGELLKTIAGVDIVHVPYRGAVFTDVIGGRVTATFQNTGAILPTVREHQLRGLVVTSLQRSATMPDLPTVAESGFSGFEAVSWFGLMAPPQTPAPVIARIHDDAVKIAADPDMRKRLLQLGVDTSGTTPERMGEIIATDMDKWAKVIKDAGIKVPD